jgi:symplekin
MDITVQEAMQDLITALIRSLGPNHGKLLTLMRTCPIGAESLALRVLTIFTEHGRASTQLVALVKGLVSERDLDPRFLIPIIAEMDKVCCIISWREIRLICTSRISCDICRGLYLY